MKIEMHFIIDENGDWEAGGDRSTAVERYEDNVGPMNDDELTTRHVIQTMEITVASAEVVTSVPDESPVSVE